MGWPDEKKRPLIPKARALFATPSGGCEAEEMLVVFDFSFPVKHWILA
jgi:hypothetical protein